MENVIGMRCTKLKRKSEMDGDDDFYCHTVVEDITRENGRIILQPCGHKAVDFHWMQFCDFHMDDDGGYVKKELNLTCPICGKGKLMHYIIMPNMYDYYLAWDEDETNQCEGHIKYIAGPGEFMEVEGKWGIPFIVRDIGKYMERFWNDIMERRKRQSDTWEKMQRSMDDVNAEDFDRDICNSERPTCVCGVNLDRLEVGNEKIGSVYYSISDMDTVKGLRHLCCLDVERLKSFLYKYNELGETSWFCKGCEFKGCHCNLFFPVEEGSDMLECGHKIEVADGLPVVRDIRFDFGKTFEAVDTEDVDGEVYCSKCNATVESYGKVDEDSYRSWWKSYQSEFKGNFSGNYHKLFPCGHVISPLNREALKNAVERCETEGKDVICGREYVGRRETTMDLLEYLDMIHRQRKEDNHLAWELKRKLDKDKKTIYDTRFNVGKFSIIDKNMC